jgi:hypothetical protein
MNGLSRHAVVDHIAAELTARRQRNLRLRSAYLKLALAILAEDDVADTRPAALSDSTAGQRPTAA